MRTLKNKIYRQMASIFFKKLYIYKLDDIGNKNKNTYRVKIKVKSIDVKVRTYIDFRAGNNG